jgi:glucuronoarabinoxylan endo-1,4-beta-xylanase
MLLAFFCESSQAQIVYTNYTFDTTASGWGASPSAGKFVSAQWNSSDVSNSPTSGSLLVTSTFTGASQTSYFWSGNGGAFSTPINGALVTNFSCFIRFDPSSPTNSTSDSYGTIQFYVITAANGSSSVQLETTTPYFHQTAGNTNWVLYSVPVSTSGNIYGIQIELQTYSDSLTGTSLMYLDDAQLTGPNAVTNGQANGFSRVDWNIVHQRIDGFGASSAWESSLSTAEANLLFSTNSNITYDSTTFNGVGLSLLRSHIVYGNNTSSSTVLTSGETSIMQQAQSLGARVWSTPWTPAAGFKSTNDIYDSETATAGGVDGGSYLGSGNNITNVNYASQLANYVANMENSYGVNIYAISVQNEPDAEVNSYEACQWSGAQIHDFTTNLFSALAAKGVGSTKIIVPESQNWLSNNGLFTPTLGDPKSAADVSIIADHDYVANNAVGDLSVPAGYATGGKALWETEVALLSGSDSSIANGIYYANRIYQYMTQANANAYHFWWLVASGQGNEGLLDTSANVTKRLFTFGQYSRFVRPNFYRINATSSQSWALISAYKDSASPAFAIVVVNTNANTDVIQTITMTNFTATMVTPWETSELLNLAPQTAVDITNGVFTYDVPAMSVVTFVGQGIIPVFTAVSNQTVNAGVTVTVTNTAAASDVPPYSLTYSAANTFPTGATLDPNTGIFNWTPSVNQANTTNLILVKVTDSDSGGASATNSFSVTVNPLPYPAFTALPNQTVNAGVTVMVTNTATASDVPPYSLTYAPANTFPPNATLDPNSGIFSWRPSVSEADTTNVIQVAATDNDSYDLSTTNTYSIIVNAITNPVLGAANGSGGTVSYSQGQFSMTITGPQGPDYSVLMSTDLVNWQTIFSTNSPSLPFTFTDTNAVNNNQYYEIQIGP